MDIHAKITALDYLVIACYVVALLGLGFWVSFRRRHTEDLFLAGRSLRWGNIGLSIWGTNISPSMMIATCGAAYTTGMVVSNYSWLAWLFLILLAMVFIPHYLGTHVSTMPQFLQKRFGPRCRVFLSYYAVFSTLVMWLGGTLYAGGLLLGQIMGWPVWVAVLVLTVIATSFTVAGGLAAVVITDSFQTILMILASAALTIIGIVKVGGLHGLAAHTPAHFWQLLRPVDDPDYPAHAILLGYPILGIWFWCTDQTIVQRVLGARDVRQGQLGAAFAAYIKILDPFVFLLPGLICAVLHPGLANPEEAYVTMVVSHMPSGMVGLIIAVLIAALISTLDSGLNSLSTVFTLDIYCHHLRPGAPPQAQARIGRIVTVVAAAVSVILALAIGSVKSMDMFSLFQSIIGFLAPPMAAVFLVGVLWPRATATAAFWTLLLGSITCVSIGVMYLAQWPGKTFWPHFMLLSFYLWAILTAMIIVLSLLSRHSPSEQPLPTLRQTAALHGSAGKRLWLLWAILAVIMVGLYVGFEWLARHAEGA